MYQQTPEQNLASVTLFAEAGVKMGKLHIDNAYSKTDAAGQPEEYSVGWAYGFQHAFKLMDDFIHFAERHPIVESA